MNNVTRLPIASAPGVVRRRGQSWEVDYTDPATGKRRRKSFPDEAVALAFLELGQRAEPAPGGKPMLRTLGDAYDRTDAEHWSNLRSHRVQRLNGDAALAFWGRGKLLIEITNDAVAEFRDDAAKRGNSPSTINNKLKALSAMMRVALEGKAVTRVPTCKRPREVLTAPRFLTPDEEKLLTAWLRNTEFREMADLCEVLLDTGLRVGQEALALKRVDLRTHPKTGRMLVYVADPKGETGKQKPRTVPATARAERILTAYAARAEAAGQERLWTLDYWTAQRQFVNARTALGWGENVVLHTLRHTCASRLVQRGANLFQVQEIMGHKDLETTRRYAHLAVDHLMSAMDLLE